MYQLIYRSLARDVFFSKDFNDLLSKCRSRNKLLHVTGMLLHAQDTFLQILEGEEATVRELYERISRDHRHHRIEMLWSGSVEQREFAQWSMGYTHANDSFVSSLPSSLRFSDPAFSAQEFRTNPADAKKMLMALVNADSGHATEATFEAVEPSGERGGAPALPGVSSPVGATTPPRDAKGDDLFFGQFLVAQGVIDEIQLLQALAYQKGRNRLLGELAQDLELLTAEQIELGKAEQKTRDVFFGDAVVQLGFLSKDDLEHLLRVQKRTHVFLGEVVAQLKFVEREAVQRWLNKFHESLQASPPAPENSDQLALAAATSLVQKVLTRSCGVPSRLGLQSSLKRGTEVHLFRIAVSSDIDRPCNGSLIVSCGERVAEKIKNGLKAEVVPDPDHVRALQTALSEVVRTVGSLGRNPLTVSLKSGVVPLQNRVIALAGSRAAVSEILTPFGVVHVTLIFE